MSFSTSASRFIEIPTAVRSSSVLVVWALTRLGIIAVAALAQWQVLGTNLGIGTYAGLWDHFESLWYEDIARNGYIGEGQFQYNAAYFPGTALVMRGGLFLGLEPAVTGMLVALVSSAAAAVALTRIAEHRGVNGWWTSLAWLIAPTTVFVVAPWSEAPFVALAFWSWVFASRGMWWSSGIAAGFASLFRINGIFLALGLIALWWFSRPRRWQSLIPLSLPFATVLGYFVYLWTLTGRLTAWRDAHRDNWGRETVDPITSFVNSWNLIFTFDPGRISSRFIAEISAVVLITIGLVLLARRRWWPEFILVGTTLAALVTSTFFYSVPRTITLLFPLWLILGGWLSQSRLLRIVYLVFTIPFTALVVVRFVDGQWIS